MHPRIPLILLIISAALLVLTLATWLASYHNFVVRTVDGRMYLLWVEPGSLKYVTEHPDRLRMRLDDLSRSTTMKWRVLGVEHFNAGIVRSFSIPFAYIALPLLALTLWLAQRIRVQRRRQRLGLCITCGYDLRESGGRCPECGREATPTYASGAREKTAA